MKRWIAILLCMAMLVIAVPAYADDCPGGCPDTSFIGQCAKWVDVVVTAVADALGIHVNVSGTVGPLPTGYDQTARLRVTLDGAYTCHGCINQDNVTVTGTEVYDTNPSAGTPSGPALSAGDYDKTFFVPADTTQGHTVQAYVGQNSCANCPNTDTVKVAPYVPPPPVCDGTVIGYEWYECNSGSWTYGPTTSAECAWCSGLSGNRVVKESYDCGQSWHWYFNGKPVEKPPVPLGFYRCGTAACAGK